MIFIFLTHTPKYSWSLAFIVIGIWYSFFFISDRDFNGWDDRWVAYQEEYYRSHPQSAPTYELPEPSWYQYNGLGKLPYYFALPFVVGWWTFVLWRYNGRISLFYWDKHRPGWSCFWTLSLGVFLGYHIYSLYIDGYILQLTNFSLADAGRIYLCLVARATLIAKS